MKTIVLTGGGTLGHVFGCLALVPKLTQKFDRICYVGSTDGIEKRVVENAQNITYFPINTPKFKRKLTIKNLCLPIKLFWAFLNCKKLLKELNPSIVFSKGGYVSVPVCLAAHSLQIPIILHESDISLGLANKLTKNKAKAVCTSFECLANKLKNGIFVGSPTRESLLTNQKPSNFLGLQNQKVLLIIGGSLGAESLNSLVFASLDFLCEHFFVVHITGKGKGKNVVHKNYKQIEFCENMEKLYAIANFAITRGGSNAIFELLGQKIPMLISPLKKQTRGEQILNANYFQKKGYALVLENETPENLKEKISLLIQREKIIKRQMDKYSSKDATQIIVDLIDKFKK